MAKIPPHDEQQLQSCNVCSTYSDILQFLQDAYSCLKDPVCIPQEDVSPFDKEAQGDAATGALLRHLQGLRSRVPVEDPVHSLTFVSTGESAIDLLEHHQDGSARNRAPRAVFEPNDYECFSPEVESVLRF
jgi:hypothetical protein